MESITDPVLSPIFADVTGWPPVYIQVSTEEILFDESIRMYLKLEEADVDVSLSVSEGMYHTYQLTPMPESEAAFKLIADFYKKY